MKILSLNCRGLGIPEAVLELRCLSMEEGPQVLFLCETKLDKYGFANLKRKLEMTQGVEVPRTGLGGGLALLWHEHIDVTVKTFSPHHIDALLNSGGTLWRFTGFYGHPATAKRWESWDLLRHLHSVGSYPWLLMGDFNEILHPDEYWGKGARPFTQIIEFQRVVDDCSLLDLGFEGPKFTWCNNRFQGNLVYERLDRGLYNQEWLNLFPLSKLFHIPFGFSDHLALLTEIKASSPVIPRGPKHSFFRFEALWTRNAECEAVIRSSWDIPQWGTPMYRLSQKIKAVRVALLQWGGRNVRGLFKSIAAKRKLLSSLESDCHLIPADSHRIQLRNATRAELNELICQEEAYWHQRSKVAWLQSGDRNTKFFHAVASHRRRRNEISKLKDSNGNWVSQQADLEALAIQYFQGIFTSVSSSSFQQVIQHMDRVVTPEMNSDLLEEFSDDEVKTALFQMHPTKALPDGMNPLFRHYWHIVG
ncbi:uncharacterized protein LOC142624853 [Castanea sativa]|uniref:uncharacterized protein LOC142624853 n=1 Tax=Castanea sativa TaxID=21020 RepID=UPI003F651333